MFSTFFLPIIIIVNGLDVQKSFEDIDLGEQLKILLNKLYVKSIKMETQIFFEGHCNCNLELNQATPKNWNSKCKLSVEDGTNQEDYKRSDNC
ncbi:hypothetical protein ACOSP7_024514 [Xanthoceras sorbifolium]